MLENPFDGSAVQLVPQNVEKLPLWHWRPGARLLAIGSRDGARFDGELDPSEARSFRRQLDPGLLHASQERAKTDGVFACWSESLRYPRSLDLLLATASGALVVATAGFGPEGQLEALLERSDAWLLMLGPEAGPWLPRLAAAGRHVELVLGLPTAPSLPDLAWDRIAAVHLHAMRSTAAVGAELSAWEAAARSLLPASIIAYGHQDRHSVCPCGATLVWRSGGRSRRDSLAPDGHCSACGQASGIVLGPQSH